MHRFLFCLFAAFFPLTAFGQTYPDYTKLYVNDFADVLNDAQEAQIRSELRALQSQEDIEFTVVTIIQLSNYGHEGGIEPFATGLFNSWGVGNANRNDGVMMLGSIGDRKVRIELGSGYGRSKNRPMKRIIDDVILPRFRNAQYPQGISEGVEAVIAEVTKPPPTWVEVFSGWMVMICSGIVAVLKFLFWPIIAGAAGLFVWLYRRYLRYHTRICPVDRTPMELLAEHWDDAHLKPGQLKEEELKSVDYDIWQCPKCEHRTIEAYKSWFSRFGACRTCGFKTLEGQTTVLQSATTSSSGLKRIDYTCLNCDDTYSVEKTIPKVSKRSSSSSGSRSSFGGGSSSGGGASGSW